MSERREKIQAVLRASVGKLVKVLSDIAVVPCADDDPLNVIKKDEIVMVSHLNDGNVPRFILLYDNQLYATNAYMFVASASPVVGA